LNLAADSSIINNLSRSHCVNAIDLCHKLNVPFYSFHAGFAFNATPRQLGGSLLSAPRFPRENAYRNFVESLKFLCEYAQKRSIQLAVENNVVTSENLVDGNNALLLGATSEELLHILDDVSSPQLGILVDVGHLKVTAKTLGFDRKRFLDSLVPKIKAFHLSDNDGVTDTHSEFGEESWFLPCLSGFSGTKMVIETQQTTVEAIQRMMQVVGDSIEAKKNDDIAN